MEPRAAAVAALAAALPPGTVRTGPDELAPLLVDWRGQKRGSADALLLPATTAEVQTIVRIAAARGIALVPQGGNTGLVGGSVPEAENDRPTVILSLRRMRRLRQVDAAGFVLVAEAGMVLADVETAARAAALRFPLSLGAKGSATVGGLVSTNAGGVQVLRHGTMRHLVLGLEAVLPDGTLLDQLGALAKDNSGYDIKQLLIGGEGTLGVVTAASLKLAPPLAAVAVGWAGVADPAAALALLGRMRHALGDRVESFELVGAAALDLVVRLLGRKPPLAGSHPFHLLFEVEADEASAGAVLEAALADGIVADATLASGSAQAARLWQLREEIPEAERREGHSVKNDVAVPVGALPAFVAEALAMVAQHFPGARPLVFGHVGDGNLHFNLRPPAGADAGWLGRHQDAARARLHDLVAAHGGSISAEHGIGTLKTAELLRLGDPGKLAAMRAVKRALDPAGIMNPGKLAV